MASQETYFHYLVAYAKSRAGAQDVTPGSYGGSAEHAAAAALGWWDGKGATQPPRSQQDVIAEVKTMMAVG